MRCEARTLDDIRALGGNDAADERRFATAARVSEINLALYRALAQPLVRAMTSAPAAEWMQQMHPLRLQYEMFSDANPFMAMVKTMADQARQNRQPVSQDNPFLAFQETVSKQIAANLDAWREMSEAAAERMFLSVYGSPVLQAAVGIDPAGTRPLRKAPKTALHRQLLQAKIAELKSRIATGGVREALVRGMLHVGMARGRADERGLAAIRRLRRVQDDGPRPTLAEFKALIREQFFMLLIDEEAALAAIPDLLPADKELRRKAFAALPEVLSAAGELSGEGLNRLRRIAQLFGLDAEPTLVKTAGPAGKPKIAKAS
jgi:hypothetical protein